MIIMTMEPKFIVVIGASAGGFTSIIELVAQIPEKLDAAFFIVLHFRKLSNDSVILERLQSNTSLRCKLAENDEPIQRGYIYIGVPDKHLVLKEGRIVLGKGPQENLWRPSIDVLFR